MAGAPDSQGIHSAVLRRNQSMSSCVMAMLPGAGGAAASGVVVAEEAAEAAEDAGVLRCPQPEAASRAEAAQAAEKASAPRRWIRLTFFSPMGKQSIGLPRMPCGPDARLRTWRTRKDIRGV
jgi:hypothetical protein